MISHESGREVELLLLLSRVSPGLRTLERAQSIIDNGVDWDSLFALSGKHGVFNLVYKNLEKLKNVPADLIGKLRHAYHNTVRRNILNISEHDRIIEGLERRGIDAISLKGPMASEEIFGDIGLYPSGDIDILVRVQDIDRMKDFLESDGYRLEDKGFDYYRDFFIRELYHVSLSKGRYVIEPHWNLFFRYFTSPPNFWWEESMMVAAAGKSYRFLSPEKNILYNSFRLFSKAFSHLRFLVMVAELIGHYGEKIDWEKMFLYARRYKFEKTLRTVLMMSVSLLGAPVPGGYAEIRGIRTKLLYRLALRMVLSGTDPHPVRKVMLVFLRDDLSGSLKILFRRLFPSMGEIVSRYRLSDRSAKAVFFYMLNPLFLFMRRHQKI
jgi:hypothetical protein